MKDCLRVVVHLARRVDDPLFSKVAQDRKRVSHVALIRDPWTFERLLPYTRQAYALSTRA